MASKMMNRKTMNRKPSWRARRIARRIGHPRAVPHRAAAADQQLRDLGQALRMPASAMPSAPGQAGRRMRLGPEARALLKRVRNSRTLREAQAWMRELAHQIRKRARIHDRRRRAAQRVRNRSRKIGQGAGRGTKRAGQWARPRAAAAGRRARDTSRRWQEPMLKRAERRHAGRQRRFRGAVRDRRRFRMRLPSRSGRYRDYGWESSVHNPDSARAKRLSRLDGWGQGPREPVTVRPPGPRRQPESPNRRRTRIPRPAARTR